MPCALQESTPFSGSQPAPPTNLHTTSAEPANRSHKDPNGLHADVVAVSFGKRGTLKAFNDFVKRYVDVAEDELAAEAKRVTDKIFIRFAMVGSCAWLMVLQLVGSVKGSKGDVTVAGCVLAPVCSWGLGCCKAAGAHDAYC